MELRRQRSGSAGPSNPENAPLAKPKAKRRRDPVLPRENENPVKDTDPTTDPNSGGPDCRQEAKRRKSTHRKCTTCHRGDSKENITPKQTAPPVKHEKSKKSSESKKGSLRRKSTTPKKKIVRKSDDAKEKATAVKQIIPHDKPSVSTIVRNTGRVRPIKKPAPEEVTENNQGQDYDPKEERSLLSCAKHGLMSVKDFRTKLEAKIEARVLEIKAKLDKNNEEATDKDLKIRARSELTTEILTDLANMNATNHARMVNFLKVLKQTAESDSKDDLDTTSQKEEKSKEDEAGHTSKEDDSKDRKNEISADPTDPGQAGSSSLQFGPKTVVTDNDAKSPVLTGTHSVCTQTSPVPNTTSTPVNNDPGQSKNHTKVEIISSVIIKPGNHVQVPSSEQFESADIQTTDKNTIATKVNNKVGSSEFLSSMRVEPGSDVQLPNYVQLENVAVTEPLTWINTSPLNIPGNITGWTGVPMSMIQQVPTGTFIPLCPPEQQENNITVTPGLLVTRTHHEENATVTSDQLESHIQTAIPIETVMPIQFERHFRTSMPRLQVVRTEIEPPIELAMPDCLPIDYEGDFEAIVPNEIEAPIQTGTPLEYGIYLDAILSGRLVPLAPVNIQFETPIQIVIPDQQASEDKRDIEAVTSGELVMPAQHDSQIETPVQINISEQQPSEDETHIEAITSGFLDMPSLVDSQFESPIQINISEQQPSEDETHIEAVTPGFLDMPSLVDSQFESPIQINISEQQPSEDETHIEAVTSGFLDMPSLLDSQFESPVEIVSPEGLRIEYKKFIEEVTTGQLILAAQLDSDSETPVEIHIPDQDPSEYDRYVEEVLTDQLVIPTPLNDQIETPVEIHIPDQQPSEYKRYIEEVTTGQLAIPTPLNDQIETPIQITVNDELPIEYERNIETVPFCSPMSAPLETLLEMPASDLFIMPLEPDIPIDPVIPEEPSEPDVPAWFAITQNSTVPVRLSSPIPTSEQVLSATPIDPPVYIQFVNPRGTLQPAPEPVASCSRPTRPTVHVRGKPLDKFWQQIRKKITEMARNIRIRFLTAMRIINETEVVTVTRQEVIAGLQSEIKELKAAHVYNHFKLLNIIEEATRAAFRELMDGNFNLYSATMRQNTCTICERQMRTDRAICDQCQLEYYCD